MKKINRKLVAFSVLVALVLVPLLGCQEKIPKGLSKDFYNDVIEVGNSLSDEMKDMSEEYILNNTFIKFESYADFCDKYNDDSGLTEEEERVSSLLASAVLDLQTNLKLYYKDKDVFPNSSTVDSFESLSEALDVKIKIIK